MHGVKTKAPAGKSRGVIRGRHVCTRKLTHSCSVMLPNMKHCFALLFGAGMVYMAAVDSLAPHIFQVTKKANKQNTVGARLTRAKRTIEPTQQKNIYGNYDSRCMPDCPKANHCYDMWWCHQPRLFPSSSCMPQKSIRAQSGNNRRLEVFAKTCC